ncbi:site-2 protease family protein [Clostridium sp. UBA4548]|uniref:site-2 protease family protein n=1 Tax=Clostridium sp. UBA4548 TaxID=1946361 RepID=UPI0025C2AFBA|nr:site-2 protease family protein [Clostridium sp. UBA4548]
MDVNSYLLDKILIIPAILLAFTFHEYAHAIVAVKLGDDTPKYQGRLTLNPFAHVDIVGFIMILLVGFGWAKPVETNPQVFKNYFKDDLKVSLAGPLANLVIAFLAVIALVLFSKLSLANENLYNIISTIIYLTAWLNCLWFFLNLIPVPGFDGFRIINDLFPKGLYKFSTMLYRYQMIIFIILILPLIGGYSILDFLVGVPGNALFGFLVKIITSII